MARTKTLWRVVASAVTLLGVLAAALVMVGEPTASSAGPLSLPDPAPPSAVRYGAPPLKVLLVGDSMAGTLGVGLGALAAPYNGRLVNAGTPGCSLAVDGRLGLAYFTVTPGAPCVDDDPGALLSTWRRWVEAYRPDVVLYLAHADIGDQQVHGTWTWIGHRDFARWLDTRLREGISALSSR